MGFGPAVWRALPHGRAGSIAGPAPVMQHRLRMLALAPLVLLVMLSG